MVQRTERHEGEETLDDLAAVADNMGGGAGEPPGTDLTVIDGPQPPTNAQLLAVALTAGRDVFCGFTKLQSPLTTLPDDKVKALADAWGPVLDKHGINLTQYMGDFALEFAALAVTLQIGLEVRAGVQAEIAQREQARQVQPPEAANDGAAAQ